MANTPKAHSTALKTPPAIVDTEDTKAAGRDLAFDQQKGNCLACHQIDGGDAPGNIAPPLVGMKLRYPNRAKLRAQIWDAAVANPETIMPPFGRNRILTEKEIDQVVAFIWSK
ncbi:hypothetical protein TI04_01060 [Achromatium sp. WMS2]|nr:hypothetical protein TI04_01060 [Achromatium sp. WMS2]